MKTKIENGKLILELPLEKPRPSSTGKSVLIASTHGPVRTTARFRGQKVSIVVNAFVYPDAFVAEPSDNDEEEEEESDDE